MSVPIQDDIEAAERRASLILLFFLLLVLAACIGAIATFACGEERWSVKTLIDSQASQIDHAPVSQTVGHLAMLKAPNRAELDAKPDSRFPEELKTYTVEGYLVGFKLEADEDFHIVLADLNDPKLTMIAEMPSDDCMPPALRSEAAILRSSWEQRFGRVSSKFKNVAKHKIKVQVTGVGFFDFLHGQTGVAESGFELHPVLSWKDVQ